MKEIRAVIGPQRLALLHDALRAVPGFPGMTVSRAESYPAPAAATGRATIRQELTDHVARWRIDMVVPDHAADALFEAVLACLSSGPPGDGAVWMVDVERASFVHRTG
jgi:nitrogen regulatory protein P-II 1